MWRLTFKGIHGVFFEFDALRMDIVVMQSIDTGRYRQQCEGDSGVFLFVQCMLWRRGVSLCPRRCWAKRRCDGVHNLTERQLEWHWPFRHRLDCLPRPLNCSPSFHSQAHLQHCSGSYTPFRWCFKVVFAIVGVPWKSALKWTFFLSVLNQCYMTSFLPWF